MAYKALYRKYRPRTFDEVVGQEHITETLKHQVMTGNISHAYLFTGSRGTGKTSTAKIFAKAVNCPNAKNGSPCFECEVCRGLEDPSNVDILEIDAASNNRVDEIRDIREKVKFLPVLGKYKVYIVDEVHMLTDQAFNALLKTLEEPPAHVIFILATTEVHKLPATILSRCMRFDFRLIPVQTLMELVRNIYNNEGIKYTEEALKLIALAGEGSCRDTISVADCVASFSQGNVTTEATQKVLGTSDTEEYVKLFDAIINKDVGKALTVLQENYDNGKNMLVFAKNCTMHARNLLVMKNCADSEEMQSLAVTTKQELLKQCQTVDNDSLMEYMKIFSSIEAELKYALSPKTLIETAIVIAISEVGEDQKKKRKMSEYKTMITTLSNSAKGETGERSGALSPRTIWGKVIIYLREHNLIALHIACGDITDVSINNGVFEIKTTENFLYELLSGPENRKELLKALNTYGIEKFEVIKKEVVLTDSQKDLMKLKEYFGDKLIIEGE